MKLVADPRLFVSAAVTFCAHVACDGQIGEVLLKRAGGLEFQAFGRSRGALLVFGWASSFLSWQLLAGFLGLFSGGFPSLDGRGIETHMPDELISQMFFDEVVMGSLRQLTFGKLIEGSRKGRSIRNLSHHFPTAKSA